MSRTALCLAGIVFALGAFALAIFWGDRLGTGTGLFLIFCIAGGLLPLCYYITEGDNTCD